MTANSPSSVAESASSTIDPDAQARRANDGELSAGFQSDLTIDEDAVDGLLTAEEFAAEFDENLRRCQLATPSIAGSPPNRPPCAELATLVARGVEPLEVFGAVADEMRRCVPADTAGLWRFETDREITIVAAAADPAALAKWPVGTRTPVDRQHHRNVGATQRPARADRQLRQHCRADRCSGARGGRARGGGGADHR